MAVPRQVVIIGAGPAGLMAASRLAEAGVAVRIFDRMPAPARKFLMAGRGGLNLTHGEPLDLFLTRYGPAVGRLAPAIRAFPPEALRAFADGLGEPTFTGSSGRVFPKSFKASPLLRAWLRRLGAAGVVLEARHRWTGWDAAGALTFETLHGPVTVRADAVILALGGASWPRLGSDGGWRALLEGQGLAVTPFAPANMGVRIDWSQEMRSRFVGTPVKRIALSCGEARVRGEMVVTGTGLEGGAVYALSRVIRDAFAAGGQAEITVDLRPDLDVAALAARLAAAPAKLSLAERLRKAAGLSPVHASLLREGMAERPGTPEALARLIKGVPLQISGLSGLERAISTAGGLAWAEVEDDFSVRGRPDLFVCGEMLDWEAPTGGYLLQACFATGRAAAEGVLARLKTCKDVSNFAAK
ncbi:TIGR03862 family flavoprotein [Azorhizobium doebereinerae]|uniref:TIGR03862 family flavoprotein n=1 Tax=Azorhizobium doebereinerae TaxID=281091 RepID=UPI0004167D6E|nr:TIGR03862 family flavoprotein [Azorhizobium doebereinerae]